MSMYHVIECSCNCISQVVSSAVYYCRDKLWIWLVLQLTFCFWTPNWKQSKWQQKQCPCLRVYCRRWRAPLPRSHAHDFEGCLLEHKSQEYASKTYILSLYTVNVRKESWQPVWCPCGIQLWLTLCSHIIHTAVGILSLVCYLSGEGWNSSPSITK